MLDKNLNRIICPSCKRPLSSVNAWHYCKTINIDDLFINKPDDIVLAFDRLLDAVADWEGIAISGTKNCIVFIRSKTFLVVKPMAKCLEVKFYSSVVIDDDQLYKCGMWGSKFEGIVRLSNEDAITSMLLKYIRASYAIS